MTSVLSRIIYRLLYWLHLDMWWLRHYCHKAMKTGSFPSKFAPEPGAFRCPFCQHQYITAYPIRDSLLEHLEECEFV